MTLPTSSTTTPHESAVWLPSLPPTDLVFDDGIPLESNRHRLAMNLLIDTVYEALAPREDFYASGNMFVYFSKAQVKNQDFRGPDFFVALGVDGRKERQGWVVWEEDGKHPDVIVELMSESTATVDLTTKKQIYEQIFKAQHYFVFDPFNPRSLQGWELQKGQYVALQPNDKGWLWCSSLELWLGTWHGQVLQETTDWLRFYFPDEQLVLLPREQEYERAQQEYERAQQEYERAQQERLRAEQVEAELAAERQQKAALRAKLRELGVDPDTV
ncbi:MAG: Uma2 family endonuclease [Cyanobacteria bacterium P01_G01_bin.54]